MSVKINKNGKEYDLGFVPQSLYDDVEDLKDAVNDKVSKTGSTQSMGVNLVINRANGTTSSTGSSAIQIGNNTPTGTAGNSRGYVELYGTGSYYVRLRAGALSANRNIDLPDKAGTLVVGDISEVNISVDSSVSNNVEILQSSAYVINTGSSKLLVGSIAFRNSSALNSWTHLFVLLSTNYNMHIVDYENYIYQYNKNGYIQTNNYTLPAGDHDFSFAVVIS